MQRQIFPYSIAFLALILVGGFAYFSRNPDSSWLQKAQDWPVVGEYAQRFRLAYLGPEDTETLAQDNSSTATSTPSATSDPINTTTPAPAPSRTRQRAQRVTPPAPTEPLRLPEFTRMPADVSAEKIISTDVDTSTATRPTTIHRPPPPPVVKPKPTLQYVPLEWMWFLPGSQVRTTASSTADVRSSLPSMAYLPILAREGNWVEVVLQDARGWIDTAQKPAHPRKGARRGLLRHRAEPIRANDSVRLRKARKIMGIDRPSVKVGAYTLYTDVEDQALLTLLDSAAKAAEEAYFARYGRLPSGNPKRSAILFASEASYREYAKATSKKLGKDNWQVGHAGNGLLAMYAEGRSPESLARTLVHEITHLLNDRSLAYSLPPWLEEGMASDLGTVWLEDSTAVMRAGRGSESWNLTVQGSESRFLQLKQAMEEGTRPSLVALLSLDRDGFYNSGNRSHAYALSFAFIRFLLDSENGRHAPGFLEFLKRIAGGLEANLLKQLGSQIGDLERGFNRWLVEQIKESEKRLEERYGQQRAR